MGQMICEVGDSYTPNHLTDKTANGCWWYVYELYAYGFLVSGVNDVGYTNTNPKMVCPIKWTRPQRRAGGEEDCTITLL